MKSKLLYISQVDHTEESGQGRFEKSFIENALSSNVELMYIGPKPAGKYSEKSEAFKYIPLKKTFFGYLYFHSCLFFTLLALTLGGKVSEHKIFVRMNPLMFSPLILSWLTELNFSIRTGPIIPNLTAYNKTSSKLFIYLISFICKLSYRKADDIICVTENIKQWVTDFANIDASKVHVISNGVNTNFFKPSKDTRQEQEISFCFICTLVPGQGVHNAIKAFARLDQNDFKLKLDIIGGGDQAYLEELQSLSSELKINDRVSFIGRLDHSLIPSNIESRDIMLATFTKEELEKGGSSALKIYEYLAMNRIVIASSHSDHQFLEDNKLGFLSEPDNIKELSEIMKIAIREYKKLEAEGMIRKYCVDNFSWEGVIGEYLKVILKENSES